MISTKDRAIREQLAALAHSQWAGWMEYLFSVCTVNDDGSATIPAWAVERWQRQRNTPYTELPESEKESDRHEAEKMIQEMILAEDGWKVLVLENGE